MPAMRRRRPLAALLVLTAVLGIFWTSAGAFGAVRLDGYQKYYKVAASYQGRPENLAEIAGRFLGGSGRSPEIFDLNAGRRQPDGGTLTDPSKLHAGWYLVLPWDAYGDGVQYGLLPATPPAPAGAGTNPMAPTHEPAGRPPANPQPATRPKGCAGTENSTGGTNQWAALRVAPDHAWSYSRGAGVMVAVVDSGVDASLPALSGRTAVGTDIVSGSGRGDTDCLGTGTAMASIIAARTDSGAGPVAGVAPDATILPVRLVTTDPHAKPTDQAAAVEFATAAGAKVIALGGYVTPNDPTVAVAMRSAMAHNVVVVTAPVRSAAPQGSLLRVGAIGVDGKPASAYESGTVDVVAPGIAVAGLGVNGTGQVEVTGAQYAVAFGAGEVALIRARYPQLTAAQVVHRVEVTANPVGTSGTAGTLGAGLIDPGRSVVRILPEENPTPEPQIAPHASTPHPFRVEALILIVVLALATAVLLILRARRIIRPDPPAAGGAAVPSAEAVGLGARLSTMAEAPAAAAPLPRRAGVPVAPVAVLDESRVGRSVGAAWAGGPLPRRIPSRHAAPREASTGEEA